MSPYSLSLGSAHPFSSQNFAAGFFGVPDFLTAYRQEILIENWDDYNNNNTLAPACRNFDTFYDYGNTLQERWIDTYLKDAVERLDPLVEGLNLTTTDVFAMQDACAYEVSNV